jgi:hypothetical protein
LDFIFFNFIFTYFNFIKFYLFNYYFFYPYNFILIILCNFIFFNYHGRIYRQNPSVCIFQSVETTLLHMPQSPTDYFRLWFTEGNTDGIYPSVYFREFKKITTYATITDGNIPTEYFQWEFFFTRIVHL